MKYTSDNEKVAVVDENGRVTAKKAGTALITASADGYQSTCRIVVKKPTFKVAKKMIKVKKGKKARIIVKVRPTTKVVFASANKKIAAVTKKGMLKGMKKGQTKIKVKCYGITNIQIFGSKKDNDTKKAQRFFKERGIRFQYIDLREKTLSKGEFRSVAAVNGGLEGMINKECKDRDALALVTYIAEEDKLDKILENPQILKIPIVRNGRQATLGYQPDVWKTWE